MNFIQGDVLEKLKEMPDEQFDCVVTSPPYWGLRDYGVEGQIGLERTPEEYVAKLVVIFREVRRVLKKNGTLWLNLGDSYAAGGNGGGTKKQDSNRGTNVIKGRAHTAPPGLKPKDLVGIPWRVAFALQADGWYLRQDIIWAKPNPMPESVRDRCTRSHEYVFLFSKSRRYFFDSDAIKEPSSGREFRVPYGWGIGGEPHVARDLQKNAVHSKMAIADKRIAGSGRGLHGHSGNKLADGMVLTDRNKRSVWSVTAKAFKGAHFAVFPEKLIEPMIAAGCPWGGAVLDPFMGAGTTAVVAKKLGRHSVGIELNPEYIEIAKKRIDGVQTPIL